MREGGAASERMGGKERVMEVARRGGGRLSEMSVGVPLKEHCLADNTPGCAGIIRAGFTVTNRLILPPLPFYHKGKFVEVRA